MTKIITQTEKYYLKIWLCPNIFNLCSAVYWGFRWSLIGWPWVLGCVWVEGWVWVWEACYANPQYWVF